MYKLTSERASALSAMRKKFGAGSGRLPKADVPRCPCDAMTEKRAIARAHHCGTLIECLACARWAKLRKHENQVRFHELMAEDGED